MGINISKGCSKEQEDGREQRSKIKKLEDEIKELKLSREKEALKYELEVVFFACKVEEWEGEKKKHAEEMAKMKMRLNEEERIRAMEGMEEAVEKWKQLYHEIKTELDYLIHCTLQGERYSRGDSEGLLIEGLHRELKAKDENVEALTSRLTEMESENHKKEREIDILRQSLKILNTADRSHVRKNSE
ncbi:hypothetical protein J5N97_028793 [Dioscorea zingiberensis]|uniref:Uncharacterized protein n=1 Tax=Dioscorea zingiberensis TaxID=325984 RepID=A0A9D5BZM1_9LILI|nr:hypothetical protein J5N97_028793 [Dioscorea zingiberensis]